MGNTNHRRNKDLINKVRAAILESRTEAELREKMAAIGITETPAIHWDEFSGRTTVMVTLWGVDGKPLHV